MMSVFAYIIIMTLIAAVIIVVSIVAYNKRLDKVTRGEVHDTHSAIPEPRSTAGVIYKTVLIILAILIYIGLSTVSGIISGLENRVSSLDSSVQGLTWEIENLRAELNQANSQVRSFNYEVSDPVDNKVNVDFEIYLKDMSDGATASLSIAGREIELKKDSYGAYRCSAEIGIFENCYPAWVNVTRNGETTGETLDIPDYFFWDYIPFPMMSCQFNANEGLFGKKCEGSYALTLDHPDKIESVSVTYISEGRELKTLDITEQAVNGTYIELDKGLDIGDDLTFRIEINTNDGYRVVEQSLMIFEAKEYPEDYEYERIYDLDGNLLWENEKFY